MTGLSAMNGSWRPNGNTSGIIQKRRNHEIFFGNDKAELEDARQRIRLFLADTLKLDLHASKSQIWPARRGITFLGFRLFNDHRRLAVKNVRRVRERIKLWGWENVAFLQQCLSLRCWMAHAQNANTVRLRREILKLWMK